MKNDAMLTVLEEAVEKLGIKLSYEDLRKGEVNTDGGVCVLRGEKRVMVHKGLSSGDRVDVLVKILSGLGAELEGVHLPPAVRKRIEEEKGDKPVPKA